MLYLCPNYSALQWQMLGEVLTKHCKNFDLEMGNIVITYINICRIAHLLSSINKLISYFKYISESQWEPALAALNDFLRILREKIP